MIEIEAVCDASSIGCFR